MSDERRRVVVAQADGRAQCGVRAPLSVGVVRWLDAARPAAVVLKATFDIGRGGGRQRAARLIEPEPVGRSIESELDPATVAYPSDFCFAKPATDVMLIGHAHADTPQSSIAASLRIGSWARRFIALSETPARAIPLLPQYLRTPEGTPAEPLGVVRDNRPDEIGFDQRRFARAAASMQIDGLSPAARLELEGLSPRDEQTTITLPELSPRVLVDARSLSLEPLELCCDTVWLDTDHERLILVWRGLLPAAIPLHAIHRLVVALERPDCPVAEILAALPRGTFGFAVEEDERVVGDPDELELSRYEALEHAAAPELALEQFAAITAELAEGRRPRKEVLEAHGLDERAWHIEERAFSERLASGIAAGDGREAAELGEAIVAAQNDLAAPHEPRSLEEYARLKVAIEGSEEPQEVMAAHRLGLGEWLRLERHWQTASAADEALGERLRSLIDDALSGVSDEGLRTGP